MRSSLKLLAALGMTGLSLAACGSSKSAKATAEPSIQALAKNGGLAAAGSTTTTAAVPPANGSVGFNAAKTQFVLPYGLGDLPAPELALAKANPKYAEGLANVKDWAHSPLAGTLADAPWYYIGPSGVREIAAQISNEKEWFGGSVGALQKFIPAAYVIHTANVSVDVSTLNSIPASLVSYSVSSNMPDLLMPSELEFQAAPVGTLDINGKSANAFCVPAPVALVHDGKVVSYPPIPVMTAGPSTVFSMTGFATGHFAQYDKGVSSCVSFG